MKEEEGGTHGAMVLASQSLPHVIGVSLPFPAFRAGRPGSRHQGTLRRAGTAPPVPAASPAPRPPPGHLFSPSASSDLRKAEPGRSAVPRPGGTASPRNCRGRRANSVRRQQPQQDRADCSRSKCQFIPNRRAVVPLHPHDVTHAM